MLRHVLATAAGHQATGSLIVLPAPQRTLRHPSRLPSGRCPGGRQRRHATPHRPTPRSDRAPNVLITTCYKPTGRMYKFIRELLTVGGAGGRRRKCLPALAGPQLA